MNILTFELKSMFKTLIIWTISIMIVVTLLSFMYSMYSSSADDAKTIFENFPEQARAAFGLDINTIFTYNGFYVFTSLYTLLAGAIMSLYFGIAVFAREKITKTSDFLHSKPTTRSKIYGIKFLAGLINVLIVNVFFYITELILFQYRSQGANFYTFILITNGIIFTELLFYFIGTFLGIFLKKIRNLAGLSTITAFIFFIITMLKGIVDEDKLEYLSPFSYFNGGYILANNSYHAKFVILSIILSAVLIISSYIVYTKKDIHSV